MDNAIKTPNRTGILVRALIVLAMCGIVNSAAVFVSPMAKHFGWTTEAIAGVATYMAFMQTPGHIISGWLLGKIGAKKTLILGCILLGLAFLLSGMVPSGSPWMLYITFSVLQGLGVGFTYTGSTYCATGWYPDKRGLASGLCMAFNGGSATFLAPLIVKLISSIGIIVTLYIVGGAIIVIGICAAIGLKSAPVGYAPAGWKAKADDPKLAATQLESLTPGQAFRTRGYWHLFLGYGLFPTMYIICYPRFSVLISDAGYSLNAATIGVSIYSICNVIGRLGMGALIDKLGYRKVYTICGICSVASSLCLMFANSLSAYVYHNGRRHDLRHHCCHRDVRAVPRPLLMHICVPLKTAKPPRKLLAFGAVVVCAAVHGRLFRVCAGCAEVKKSARRNEVLNIAIFSSDGYRIVKSHAAPGS